MNYEIINFALTCFLTFSFKKYLHFTFIIKINNKQCKIIPKNGIIIGISIESKNTSKTPLDIVFAFLDYECLEWFDEFGSFLA